MSVRERHRREREARGNAILAAAARVFARHGLDAATVEMVAREAEVAVGTIYLYFSSRDDLYLSLAMQYAERLRSRYLEIQARDLDALSELSAIVDAYMDHLRNTREIMLSQQSVGYAQLQKRLRRPSEVRRFKRVMDLSHEIFSLWERTIRRCFDAGVIANGMAPTKAAAVIWATLQGAFILMGDDNFFRDVTGLNPEHFVEETLESHLAVSLNDHASNAARNGRAKNKREGKPTSLSRLRPPERAAGAEAVQGETL